MRVVEVSETASLGATLHAPLLADPSGFRLDRAAKRAFDLTLSLLLLVCLAPLFIVCVAAIAAESRGPVFFRCRRVGLNGKDLYVLKFRKMRHGELGPSLTEPLDARFTRLGPLLAKTKLDELPQLWSVLKGDMSIVGPRPEDEEFVRLHGADYDAILSVRPGITGLSQLAFASESRVLDPSDRIGHYVKRILPQKAAIDLMYVERRTMSFDLRILFWTVLPVILRRDVAVNRTSGALTLRRRAH